MLASQTLNKDIAKEVVSIRASVDNAYREILSIHPILKRNSSLLESFEERLSEFAFLSALEEKFKLLSVSLDARLSSFSSKIDSFFAELSTMKKSLDEEKRSLEIQKKEFSNLHDSFISFKKMIENDISAYRDLFQNRMESTQKEDEKLRQSLKVLFLVKDDENKQKDKDLLSKIEASDENSKSLLEEMRRLKISIRVLENNFVTLRNKEKG